jgi:hypothetical protein
VKITALHLAFAAAVGFVAFTAADGPAAAAHVPDPPTANMASPIPAPTPFYDLSAPPISVILASAADACADDVFLSYRSIDTPVHYPVTVCGSILAAPASGTTHAGSFSLDVDGTEPIAVVFDGAGAPAFQAGQQVVVRGVYHRTGSSAEWIDQTRVSADLPGYILVGSSTFH